MTTVQNDLRKRSKALRRVAEDVYAFGWETATPRAKPKTQFHEVGSGSMEQALEWMERPEYETSSSRVHKRFAGH